MAAILVARVNFGFVERSSCVAWDRRNRETDRLAQEEQRRREDHARADNARAEEEYRRAEAKEQATRRARVEIERNLALLSFLADPSEQNQRRLTQVLALLHEYRDTLT